MKSRMKRDESQLTDQLESLCSELSTELGLQPPKCGLWKSDRVAALVGVPVFGGKAQLRVSRGALEKLDPMALRWIVAHELGHLADRPGLRRARAMGRWVLLTALAAIFVLVLVPVPVNALALPLLLWHVPAFRGLRGNLEREADRTARRLCAADPDAARRALTAARESSGLRAEWLFRLVQTFSGYPPFDERIAPAAD